jgi:hypothetical protein
MSVSVGFVDLLEVTTELMCDVCVSMVYGLCIDGSLSPVMSMVSQLFAVTTDVIRKILK